MFESKKYWENRYVSGGNSGSGSYGKLAQHKSDILNEFIFENNIKSILEYGCGDGNQLSQLNCDKIYGIDVSYKSIEMCKNKIKNGIFIHSSELHKIDIIPDLTVSLDVLYHLIEDDVYDDYMRNLINFKSKYIIIYSSNEIGDNTTPHVKKRKFTDNIHLNKYYSLTNIKENKYPFNGDYINSSYSNWFYYVRK
jgi:hypothetical protein